MRRLVVSPNPVPSLGFLIGEASEDGGPGRHVANVYRKADADAFAALPALLAAAREIETYAAKSIYPQPDKPDTAWGALQRLRAAIAAADGAEGGGEGSSVPNRPEKPEDATARAVRAIFNGFPGWREWSPDYDPSDLLEKIARAVGQPLNGEG